MMTALLYFFGSLIGLLGVFVAGLGLFALCGWFGMDGLFSLNEPVGELTCWHCGETTRAGARHCTRCGQELQ